MYLVLFISVALALGFHIGVVDGAEDDPIFRPDYTYVPSTKSFYKYHLNAKPWQTAKEICESERTSLFYPESEQEVKVVKRFITGTNTPRWYWIGAEAWNGNADTAKTIDGRFVKDIYNKWESGEPNNVNGGERCIVIMEVLSDKFNDYHCNALMPFLCKLTLQAYHNSPTLQDYELNVPPQDVNYELEDRLNPVPSYDGLHYLPSRKSFYRFHKDPATWSVARDTCKSEGAKLFFPEDLDEASKVLALSHNTHWHHWIWTGIYYSDSKYITVDGRTINEVFKNWVPKEPDTKDCVVLQRDGSYRDLACSTTFPYICKRPNF